MTQSSQHFWFPPFRLDPIKERLWRGEKEILLGRKPFAVLRYLIEHAGEIATKEEMLDAVWSDVQVSEGVLAVNIRELRKVLGDKAKTPRFIETVHGRGYCWIAETRGWRLEASPPSPQVSSLKSQASSMVGREPELAQLHRWLVKAESGERQIVFVTGEPGIGKTTVVEAFLAGIGQQGTGNGEQEKSNREQATGNWQQGSTDLPQPIPDARSLMPDLWIARGQCIEHYGAGEAYLPVLEALGRLCRKPGGEYVQEILKHHAPTWLAQMPTLLDKAERATIQRGALGATRERMLRELAEAIEALTHQRPLVLVLEDLHWSDYSTLDVLSVLAQRRERARLLLLGTYRPVEVALREHPLQAVKHELTLHRRSEELRLDGLGETAVTEYVEQRFPQGIRHAVPLRQLARAVHQRTEGNPLFMVNVVEDLRAQGIEIQRGTEWRLWEEATDVEVKVPLGIRQMIERQIGRLTTMEQRVLETASVAGAEFSAAAVAAGVQTDIVEIEETCTGLARRELFLRERGSGEWPDGTVAARYEFRHALYHNALYDRVTAGKKARLHQRVGERLEEGYGERTDENAAELAAHFEHGRDYRRAVQYLGMAGGKSLQRSAHREAIAHLTKALALLKTLPETYERDQQELALQMALGPACVATRGWGASDVGSAYTRARELCQKIGETPRLAPTLYGLWTFYVLRAEHRAGLELAEQLFDLARRTRDPILSLTSHTAMAVSLLFFGEFARVREHLDQSIALYDLQQHGALAFVYAGIDPGVLSFSVAPIALWALGYPDQALKRSQAAVSLARELGHPFSLAYALHFAALVHQLRREEPAVQEQTAQSIALSSEQGFAVFFTWGILLRGWALAQQQKEEGISQIHEGMTALRATGAELWRPHSLALLAEAHGKAGKSDTGLALLDEALAVTNNTEERLYEAEVYRLKGELLLAQQGKLRE